MNILFVSHPDCALHEMAAGHPESPARLEAISSQLESSDIASELVHVAAPFANKEQLYRVHDRRYVDAIFDAAPTSGNVMLDPDTSMNQHSLNAALRAAGAVVFAVDQVMTGEINKAFCSVRPPGHHAESLRAMGFCIFNNVAVGAAHALQVYGLEKVAIFDFDVHHGNGTEDMFSDNPAVMLCSSFQYPFYPYSGADTRSEHIINLPLPAGTDGKAYRTAVEERLIPALDGFEPDLILISAGFDAHAADPLASLRLVEEDYAWVSSAIREIAERHAKGRVVSTLEGGYELGALALSVEAHLRALL
jgi:acetoin utilization deacetylase AcuC-like enzyme